MDISVYRQSSALAKSFPALCKKVEVGLHISELLVSQHKNKRRVRIWLSDLDENGFVPAARFRSPPYIHFKATGENKFTRDIGSIWFENTTTNIFNS